jgi:hypothetical protein
MAMSNNAILDELHAIRRDLLAKYDGDTAAYLRDAQLRLEASGRPIAHREQRTIRGAAATSATKSTIENRSAPVVER